jgi:hypothetical protein
MIMIVAGEELVGEGDHRPQRRSSPHGRSGEMVGAADGAALVDADRSATVTPSAKKRAMVGAWRRWTW